MPCMIPETLQTCGPGMRAESLLFYAIKESLPEDFFVYHGLNYVTQIDAHEGEADFVVLHRELGMLVIECKGSGVRRNGVGEWVRINADGKEEPLKKSPFAQAQINVKELVKELKLRISRMFPSFKEEFPFAYGYSVAFPLALADKANLPLDATPTILFDKNDLPCLYDKVKEAMDFWRKGRGEIKIFEPHEFKQFRKNILHPRLHIVQKLGTRMEIGRQMFARLTDQQIQIIEGLKYNKRLRVTGGAGTGKSVLALEMARMHASEGRDVLLLCFNRSLGSYLKNQVDNEFDVSGNVKVTTFPALCMEACHMKGERPKMGSLGNEFWVEDAPLMLLDALATGLMQRWDVVVVDEGQDFAPTWWDVIEECLNMKEQGSIVIFYDQFQDIFGRSPCIPEWPMSFHLSLNFRNTRHITEALKGICPVQMEPHPEAPDGEPPAYSKQDGKSIGQIEKLISNLVEKQGVRADQITMLTPHSRQHSLLMGKHAIAGIPLADDPLNRENQILHTTIGRFKGLESDIVIIADMESSDPLCGVEASYVAQSRARQMLYIFSKD